MRGKVSFFFSFSPPRGLTAPTSPPLHSPIFHPLRSPNGFLSLGGFFSWHRTAPRPFILQRNSLHRFIIFLIPHHREKRSFLFTVFISPIRSVICTLLKENYTRWTRVGSGRGGRDGMVFVKPPPRLSARVYQTHQTPESPSRPPSRAETTKGSFCSSKGEENSLGSFERGEWRGFAFLFAVFISPIRDI